MWAGNASTVAVKFLLLCYFGRWTIGSRPRAFTIRGQARNSGYFSGRREVVVAAGPLKLQSNECVDVLFTPRSARECQYNYHSLLAWAKHPLAWRAHLVQITYIFFIDHSACFIDDIATCSNHKQITLTVRRNYMGVNVVYSLRANISHNLRRIVFCISNREKDVRCQAFSG